MIFDRFKTLEIAHEAMHKEGKRGRHEVEMVLTEREELMNVAVAAINALSETHEPDQTAKKTLERELRRTGETICTQSLEQAAIQYNLGL